MDRTLAIFKEARASAKRITELETQLAEANKIIDGLRAEVVTDTWGAPAADRYECLACGFWGSDREFEHKPDCPVARANARGHPKN